MKKVTISLLFATVCSSIILSCHKIGHPGKKTCQIRNIQFNHENNQSQLTYMYNHKRQLTSIAREPDPAAINITYNNQGKPITGNNFQNVPFKYIYENERVVRIDYLGADNLYHPRYTYVYDSLGRVAERIAENGATLRWEYEGTSPNYIRMLDLQFLRPGRPLELFAMHTYEYDDKTNPWSAWPNLTLNPFHVEVLGGGGFEHIPIQQNNVTVYTLYFPLRGLPLKSDEVFITYQYDGDYPATAGFLRLVYNPFIGGVVDSTRGVNYYNYDCVGGKNNNKPH